MKILSNKLQTLHNDYNIIGIKQSTEDEGALYDDILLMRRITESNNLKLSVKIGGCEAKTDINFCRKILANGIVAPMVESGFALQKFIESTIDIKNIDLYINIESKTAFNNLDDILNSPSSRLLKGIVIGRSDLTKSFGHSKDYVDSSFMHDIVYKAVNKISQYGLTTLMGGNISPKSSLFIKRLYSENLLHYIETRNVIIKLNNNNVNDLNSVIKSSLLFESEWLNYKASYYNQIGAQYINRSSTILDRL